MPAQQVYNQLLPAQGQELIVIVDDFGTEYQLYIRVSEDSTTRRSLIDSAIAQQTDNETALKTYASAHNIDLTAQLLAGAAKKAALKQ